jgi:Spy/CpxP family protein refolding chaperone
MMLAEAAVRGGVRQHWWKALLALSLAVNLFFIGGAVWIHVHPPAEMLSPEDRLGQMAGELNLDAHQRQAFAHYAQTMRERLKLMHQSVQPLIAGAWSEFGKPQADEAKVMQLFDQAAQQRRSFARDLTTTTLSFLETLSPEQRAQFVQLARQRPRPWSPPNDHDGSHR